MPDLVLDIPMPDKGQDAFFSKMMIDDATSMLTRVLKSIKKWEEIAGGEFEEWKAEMDEKHPEGFEYYDPINDEGIMLIYTEYALYGSLAVNISAFVENQLTSIFQMAKLTVIRDGSSGKEAKRPHLCDYLYTIEQRANISRKDLLHYDNHFFVRELDNRFKHSGGISTQEFIDEYGSTIGINAIDEHIQYNKFCWERYIDQAKEFLYNIFNEINKNTPLRSAK